MRFRGSYTVTLATALALALAGGAAPASAEPGRLADFGLHFTSTAPNTPTGLSVHIVLRRAGDPNGKPSPIRSAVITLPSGWRSDSGAVPQCTAGDDELKTRGSDACPPDTQLTVGSFSAITGFGPPVDPLAGDDHVFNGPSQLIEVITAPGSSLSPAADRLTIDGTTITAHPPKAPGGPPDGESAVRSIDFAIPVRAAAGRSLFTTPPDCPGSGRWTSTGTFGFADGSTDTVASVTPCEELPALRVAVRPRRVRAGTRVRFSVRVRSSASDCIAGARVRFAGRTVRTNRHGRAALAATLRRPGLRRA